MIPSQVFNRGTLISSMTLGNKGNSTFSTLLNCLSTKELKILQKHSDLRDRVSNIAKMTTLYLIKYLKEEYSLGIENCQNGHIWVDAEKLEGLLPDFHVGNLGGDYVSIAHGNFENWARNFLMQEVRINIWVRYLVHKKKYSGIAGFLAGYWDGL